tara:strand:- start:294 stop:920 length:627 start_codon:yes stop_codon:yes gene_type:complete
MDPITQLLAAVEAVEAAETLEVLSRARVRVAKRISVAKHTRVAKRARNDIPSDFKVEEKQRPTGQIDKYYITPTGKKLRSLPEVRRWLKEQDNADSESSSDESSCDDSEQNLQDDDDIDNFYIRLSIVMPGRELVTKEFLPNTLVKDIIQDILGNDRGVFFYDNCARNPKRRLQDFMRDPTSLRTYVIGLIPLPPLITHSQFHTFCKK